MMRLTEQTQKNSPEEYDSIFFERMRKEPDEHDMRRWKTLLRHYHGGRILDAGCLDSEILQTAYKHCGFTTGIGIDTAEDAIQYRNNLRNLEGVFYMWGDVYNTTFEKEYFDYVVLGEVLEHLDDPEKAIEEAVRVLKPGGTLAISVPLNEAKEPGACDKERHVWSFSKADLEMLLMPYGKVELDTVGSRHWPIWKYRYCWPSLIAYLKKS